MKTNAASLLLSWSNTQNTLTNWKKCVFSFSLHLINLRPHSANNHSKVLVECHRMKPLMVMQLIKTPLNNLQKI